MSQVVPFIPALTPPSGPILLETNPGNHQPRVLVVDDDRTLRLHLTGLLGGQGYAVTESPDGQSALTLLQQSAGGAGATLPDVILLDRDMPGLDGLAVVRLLRADAALAHLPIVMVTGADQPDQVREGIAAGVFYYLTKPVDHTVLQAVVGAAVQEARRRRILLAQLARQQDGYRLLETATLRYATLADAERLATFLAPAFPQPERVLSGLSALLLNAVEHGLLGLGYQAKSGLLATGQWLPELQRREALPEHAGRQVQVTLQRNAVLARVTITDPGPGFPWRNYLQLSPDRAGDNHGRGIAMAAAISFDRLAYNETGNSVSAEAGLQPALEW